MKNTKKETKIIKKMEELGFNWYQNVSEANLHLDLIKKMIEDFDRKELYQIRRIAAAIIEEMPDSELNTLCKLLCGYVFIESDWLTLQEFRELKKRKIKKFKETGYADYNELFFGDKENYIYAGNIIFKNCRFIIKMIFDSGQEYIVIDDELVQNIKNNFSNINKISKRSFCSVIERQDFVRKVSANEFVPRKKNEKEIFQAFLEQIEQIDFKYLTKEYLESITFEISQKYNLIGDEWYYILKEYGTNLFNFPLGNSMAISKKDYSFELTIEERAKKLWSDKVVIMSLQKLCISIGASSYATINFPFFWEVNNKIIYFDRKNTHHIDQMKLIFDPMILENIGQYVSIAEIKRFLSKNTDPISLHLSRSRTFTQFLNIIYPGLLRKIEGGRYFLENPKADKYIDADDWSDF